MKLPCFVHPHKSFWFKTKLLRQFCHEIFTFHCQIPLSYYHIWHQNIAHEASVQFIYAYLNAIWCQCKSNKFNLMANISDASLFSWTTFMPPSTSINASLEYFDPPELLVVSERNEIKCWFIISLKWWCLLTYTTRKSICVGVECVRGDWKKRKKRHSSLSKWHVSTKANASIYLRSNCEHDGKIIFINNLIDVRSNLIHTHSCVTAAC